MFSAVFLLFPARLHAIATTIAGVVAVLAPTIGPVVGGFITDTWSWPWLFLINVVPGPDLCVGDAAVCCRGNRPIWRIRRSSISAPWRCSRLRLQASRSA